jgi:hypothetical protein
MREVNLLYHYAVDTLKRDWPLPVEDIMAFFRTARVSLQMREAEGLDVDPNGPVGDGYEEVVASLPNEPAGTAHLYVGFEPPAGARAMAGQLLDLEKRRAAVVYANSSYVCLHRLNGLLQTAVHEIGHMLNLGHPTPDTNATAMHQATYRTGRFDDSWTRARTDAARAAAAFFIAPDRIIQCYPFSLSDRIRVNTLSDDIILPGGQKYQFSRQELNE